MTNNLKLVKGYRENEKLRMSFNKLAQKIFQLSFEDWYQNGYWKDQYIPYSMVDHDQVVANVSVSTMDFESNGTLRRYIQLGTVMTEPSYRNQGLIGRLMEEVNKDFEGKADGWFLFANDSVLEFYPKFGFQKEEEYRYSKVVQIENESTVVRVPMDGKEAWNVLEHAMAFSVNHSSFGMKNNAELIMFYVTKFMQSDVYYIESQKAYVIAEIYDKILFLHQIISNQMADIDAIAEAFGKKIRRVILGFTPLEKDGYEVSQLYEPDTTLFLKGMEFSHFKEEKKMFPTLSHT